MAEQTRGHRETSEGVASARAGGGVDGAPVSWTRTHLWHIQFVRDLLLILAIVGAVYVGYVIRIVTVPALLAMALAYLVEPLVRRASSLRLGGKALMSRGGVALGLIVLGAALVVAPLTIGAGFGVVQAARAFSAITDGASKVQASIASPTDNKLRDAIPNKAWLWLRDQVVEAGQRERAEASDIASNPAASTTNAADSPEAGSGQIGAVAKLALGWIKDHTGDLGAVLGRQVVGGSRQAVGAAVTTFATVGSVLITGVLTAFFFYFFVVGWGRVLVLGRDVIPEANREQVFRLTSRMDNVIAGFVRGRVTICLIVAVVMTMLYWLAGVPAPLVLGPMVGLLFLVPFVHAIGVPIAMLLMFLDPLGQAGVSGTSALWAFQREWWWIVFAPIGIYMIAQFMDDWVLTPTIQGKTTDLSIPLILFASLAGGALAGIYGLLIAIPAAACLKIAAEEVLWPRVRAWVSGRASDFLPLGKGDGA
jgi:predicted PurR-regulated permease PerM